MSQIHISATSVINAPPEQVYAIFADYHQAHPAILPKPYFTDLVVEKGGYGAGTLIRVEMEVFGVKQTYHMEVSEREPGRVLVETDKAVGMVTTFTVDPLNHGQQAQVTIASESPASPGLKGIMEKLFNPPIARYIYKKELGQLAEYVRRQAESAS